MSKKLYVIKRSGRQEAIHFDKITSRLLRLCSHLSDELDIPAVVKKVIAGIYAGITTSELDILASEICAAQAIAHPDYGILAARITASNLQKQTPETFSKAMEQLHSLTIRGQPSPLISTELLKRVRTYQDRLNSEIRKDRDASLTYFGLKTLLTSYLLKDPESGQVLERPQYLFMRVACALHSDLEQIIETYHLLSQKKGIHASPTLFHAGTPTPGLSSCFLVTLPKSMDSVDGLYHTLLDCARISKSAGGIGLSVHDVRAKGALIHSSGGQAGGLVPFLKVLNGVMRHISQSGKRLGSAAVFVEPWHADLLDFLELKNMTGSDDLRARDLFYGLWIPDLFMKRVQENGPWSLMCPSEAPGLADQYGEAFENLYVYYEESGRVRRTMPARDIWFQILQTQIETGTPYMLFKDAVNHTSNQKHLGTIRGSNLCCEIVLYTSAEEQAVCTLASVGLPGCLTTEGFDMEILRQTTRQLVFNLNQVIDKTHYPAVQALTSNERHRPIGLGVSGLADVFHSLSLPYDSEVARDLNVLIFETIYASALEASCDWATEHQPYASFAESPASEGHLHIDGFKRTRVVETIPEGVQNYIAPDWTRIRKNIQSKGLGNAVLTALMPTASSAQILGYTESFEPLTSNVYSRKTLSGEFMVVNDSLVRRLMSLGLWDSEMSQDIVLHQGSIQHITKIPQEIREIYRTVWEIPPKHLLDMARDRAPFIDQTQSFNVYMAQPDFEKLSTHHMYAWTLGLKTGMYYLRSQGVAPLAFHTLQSARAKCDDACLSCST